MELNNINKIKFNFEYYNFNLKYLVVIIKNRVIVYDGLKLMKEIKSLIAL